MFNDIQRRLQDVNESLNLSKKELEILKKPKQVSEGVLKVGKNSYPAWRSLFNDSLGPGKGGIRFHQHVNKKEVIALSFLMMIKNSLAELPYGGGKGGVKFNPKNVDKKEMEAISRAYARKFYKVLGENKDVPAPDMYTNAQTMAWMLDEYEKKVGHHEPAMITGKPLELEGCELRNDATASGGFIVTKELIKDLLKRKKKLTFAVQGFGNAGAYIAKMLHNEGHSVVSVSDSSGGIYKKSGLDIKKVLKAKEEKGSVTLCSSGSVISNEELLSLDVDILVLAALENQITDKNVDNIKAKYIVELANNPITHVADKVLFEKGVVIVPDVLANAGGVVVSYFEWAQNKTGNLFDKKYLENKLKEKMIRSWNNVMTEYKKNGKKISMRNSAYVIAIRRILKAEKLRGNLD